MTLSVGDRLPEGSFGIMTEKGPASITTDELFGGKKVVLISVPGAFTPTCSMNHLPGYIQHADEILAAGADTIACMAVNDVFVMDAWGRDCGVDDKIVMLADGNADYVRSLGLDMDSSRFNMGIRGQRFALIVEDGVATHVAVEAPAQFEVSKAEAILAALG